MGFKVRNPAAFCRGQPLSVLAALMLFAMLPVSGICHPDLVAQIEILDARIQAGEFSAELLLRRGDLYRRDEDFSAAARDFEAARVLAPDNSLIDFYQGRLSLESGHPEAAERHLVRYPSSNSKHAKAWMLRGEANIQLGRPERAALYFERAIQTAKTPSPGLYRLLILSRVAIGETAWGAAAEAADTGLARFGLEATLLGLGTDIALARNQPAEARRYLAQLPDALHTMPQWDARTRSTDCLAASSGHEQAQCLQLARDDLANKVQVFLSGS
jgi:tetratricopeptide (TPR) repeat protein